MGYFDRLKMEYHEFPRNYDNVPFIALSYCWGSDQKPDRISLNGYT